MWTSAWIRWAVVLGVALGGFFDGILLHQILQWHHLLSLVPGLSDLRQQMLWDGYFHALMYLVAAVGLWGLWRARGGAGSGDGRQLGGGLLIGFGLWHCLDALLSHWLLGIHRIKLDSPDPLLWDLAWVLVFGVVPLALGWLLLRGGTPRRLPATSLLLLSAVTLGAAGWSLRPAPGQPFTAIVFRAGLGPDEILASLAALDARLVWTDPAMSVVIVDVAPARARSFYRHGALLVGGSGAPAGCFAWVSA